MSIPAFDLGGVLPPFLGVIPGNPAMQSPHRASMDELVHRFGTTAHRNALLRGLLNLRAGLRAIGISGGFQWIDGSFCENMEAQAGRGPSDIDLVTVFERPAHVSADVDWRAYISPHLATLFNPRYCKLNFGCDAYVIDLGTTGQNVAQLSAYWFGLFSHQKNTYRWKGIVQCPLGLDPIGQPASDELARRGF